MRLNIICGNRVERMPRLMNEIKMQWITDYEFWDGIYVSSIKRSINLAHKQIVEYAMIAGWDEVAIAEDDVKFSAPGAWDYFLNHKPDVFDLYLGGIFLGQPDENGLVTDFTGMTCYVVAKRFYETFLSIPEDEHIDRALGGLGRFVVCQPFIATQFDGHSSNTGKNEVYGSLQANRTFFNG